MYPPPLDILKIKTSQQNYGQVAGPPPHLQKFCESYNSKLNIFFIDYINLKASCPGYDTCKIFQFEFNFKLCLFQSIIKNFNTSIVLVYICICYVYPDMYKDFFIVSFCYMPLIEIEG